MNTTFLFTYASLAHGLLAYSYINKIDHKHREKLLYLFAHIFITLAMCLRINESYIGNIIPSLFGTIGHSLLLIFFILSTYIFHKKYHVAFNDDLYYLNNICIFGQIGMILIYWLEYFKKHKYNLENKPFFYNTQNFIFTILSLFYLCVALKSPDQFSSLFLSLIMISILYVFFFI